MLGAVVDAENFEERIDAFFVAGGEAVVQFQREGDVFAGGEGGDEIELLKDDADAAAAEEGELAFGHSGERFTGNFYEAGRRAVQGRAEVEQGGFAGTGGAHDGKKFAGGHGEINATERGNFAFSLAIVFGKTGDFDGMGHARFPAA